MKKLLSLLLLSPSLLAATGNVVSYDTLDQLLTTANPTSVSTELSFKGRNTVGDGGGGTGIFVQDTTSTNLGTIFNSQHPNGSGWQFQRKYDRDLNVKWFGAKGDGATDDTAAIQAAFDTALASGQSVFFPGTNRYSITSPVFVGAPGVDIDMGQAWIVNTVTNTPAIVIGETGQLIQNRNFKLNVTCDQTLHLWESTNHVGIMLIRVSRSVIEARSNQHTIGLKQIADGGDSTHNVFQNYFGYDNRYLYYGVNLATGGGAVNANTFIGGGCRITSSVARQNIPCFGYVLVNEGSSTPNDQNVWLNPTIELLASNQGEDECRAFLFSGARDCTVYGARFEEAGNIVLECLGNTTDNKIEYNYAVPTTPGVWDKSTNGGNWVQKNSSYGTRDTSPLKSTPDLLRMFYTSGGGSGVAGWAIGPQSGTNISQTATLISRGTTGVVVGGSRSLGRIVDTTSAKSFVINQRHASGSPGAVVLVRCFAADGSILTSADPNHPYARSSRTLTWNSSWNGYLSGTMTTTPNIYVTVGEDVASAYIALARSTSNFEIEALTLSEAPDTRGLYNSPRNRDAGGMSEEALAVGIVNVKDYGAVGDGSTDDTAAIQAAVNAGSPVVFPVGVYRTSGTISIPSNRELYGSVGAIIQGSTTNYVLSAQSKSNIKIRDLSVYGVGAPYVDSANNINNTCINFTQFTNVVVSDCVISNFAFAGIQFYTGTGAEVRNCRIYGAARGQVPQGGNYMFGIRGYTGTHQLKIVDNVISNTATGILIATDSRKGIVQGNQIYDSLGQHGMYLEVCGDYSVIGNVISNYWFTGTKMQIQTGSSLNVENVTIQGNTYNAGNDAISIANNQATNTLEFRNVSIVGNVGMNSRRSGYGVQFDGGRGLTVANNRMESFLTGISVRKTTNVVVSANSVENCDNLGLRVTEVDEGYFNNNVFVNTGITNTNPNAAWHIVNSGLVPHLEFDNNTEVNGGSPRTYPVLLDGDMSNVKWRGNRFGTGTIRSVTGGSIGQWEDNEYVGFSATAPVINSFSGGRSYTIYKQQPPPFTGTGFAGVYAKTNGVDRVDLYGMDSLGNETQLTNPTPFVASDTFIYDIPTISANSMIEFDIAYANAKEGDVFLAYSAAVSKIIVAAACYVDGTVRVGIFNGDTIAINPPPAEFTIKRLR